MSRNNDSLPMLPPWLSESDVTQVGYEAPVENLPQDDEIDEAPKRRRFMSRGDDAARKDKGRRRRKDRESEEEAPAQHSARQAEPVDQRRPAEPTPQSGWSAQPPANPLIPGPSHQQPAYDQPPHQQPGYPGEQQATQGQAAFQQPTPPLQAGQYPQAVPEQQNTGRQAAPDRLTAPTSAPPSSIDPAPRPDAPGPLSAPGPSAADPAPWAVGQASTLSPAPWQTGQPTADPALSSTTGAPPPIPPAPSPTSGHAHAGPATAAPNVEAADHAANALPTRTPAPPSTGFTPLGPNQRPDLPPPPPLPDPPARPTQAPPRLTVPPTAAESRPVTGDREVTQAGPATSAPATPGAEGGQPATQSASARTEAEQAIPPRPATEAPEPSTATTPTSPAESAESQATGARHSAGWSMPDEQAPANTTATADSAAQPSVVEPQPDIAQTTSESAPQHPVAQTPPISTPEASSDAGHSDVRSPHPAGESAPSHGSPYSSGESVAPQRPTGTEQRSPYATGEHARPTTYPPTQYNSVPGDPTPAVLTHAPDGRTEVIRSDDPRLQNRVPSSEHGQPNRQSGAQTGYRSGEFVQAADAASPYPRPDGTPAQHQQPDGLPTYGPDGVAQRPDGVTPQYRPEAAPAQQYQQPNQGAQQQFPAPQHQPDGTVAPYQQQPNGPAQQFHPDGTPVQQYNQPNGPQYQPDGTPAQQYQQPNAAPQQYQQPGNYQQGQQPPYGQPGWGAQPQGYQPSLDDVPVKRAKKAPGSGWRKAVHHVSGGAINPGMSAEELRLQELVARIRQPVRGDYRIAVLSLKGGVGKTTTTTGLGSIFASIRGDRVIAVDANPDFGTLSQRVAIQTRSTVRDLLLDPAIQRYSDVRRHTSQGSSRLEVLASERDPAASEAFNDEEYRAVARILQRFYNIILTDCGTGLMHSAMSGVLDLAHSLVLISSAAIDGARSAAATLDWLSLHGHDHLVRNAVVVINLPREGSPNVGVQQLRQYFLSRCRAVHIIPFDEHLSEGAEIDLHRLHKTTKRAYVELAATVADEFSVHHHRLG
ncbi:AAA family ATPase [Nocardia salmonicida]|uniref:MinD/ParA family ATP-binding protein n=1 Tax=Nocardia salmonicida TaxID=53431 RepID=UPI003F57ACDA